MARQEPRLRKVEQLTFVLSLMSYIADTGSQLREILVQAAPYECVVEQAVSFAKQRVAESYRNGMEATERMRAGQRATARDARRGLTGRGESLRQGVYAAREARGRAPRETRRDGEARL